MVPPLQLSDAVESWLLDAVGFSHYRMQQLTRQYEMAGHTLTPNRLTRAVSPGLAAVVEKASLDAGRESVEDLIVHDNQATGRYARIARPKACGWCKMLASRGFVYQEETVIKTKNGNDYHVGCRCVPIPQFTEDQDLPEQNRALADLWAESTRGLSGKDAISAFRAATGETKGTKWPERASD